MSESRRATSLVETLVALALLAVVLISAGTGFSLALGQVRAGAHASIALATATTILERIELQPFARLRDGEICVTQAWTPEDLPGGRVELRIEAADGSELELATVLRVAVIVCWEEGLRSRCTRLATVRS